MKEDIEVIGPFENEYEFLSNFYVEQSGKTLEHYYQAAKAKNTKDYMTVFNTESPGKAKRKGRNIQCRENWEQAKYWIMHSLVMFKFLSDPILMEKLINTKDKEIIEINRHHDNIWGDCICDRCKEKEGKNWLGEILTDVRNYVRMVSVIPSKHEDINDINTL